jgi:hypothetical protein
MILLSIVKLGHLISPMSIKFSIYSLSTNFSSNNINVPLDPHKWNTWVILSARMVFGWILRKLKLCRIGLSLKLLRCCGFLGLTSYYDAGSSLESTWSRTSTSGNLYGISTLAVTVDILKYTLTQRAAKIF